MYLLVNKLSDISSFLLRSYDYMSIDTCILFALCVWCNALIVIIAYLENCKSLEKLILDGNLLVNSEVCICHIVICTLHFVYLSVTESKNLRR